MLEVRGQGPVDRTSGPAVVVGLHVLDHPVAAGALDARLQLRSDLAEHRLDREDHSFAQLDAPSPPAVVVDLRILVHPAADSMADKVPDDVKPARLRMLLDRGADVTEVTTRTHLLDREIEALLRGPHEEIGSLADFADADRDGRIADEAVEDRSEVESEDVALIKLGGVRDSVTDHVVHGSADHRRIRRQSQRRIPFEG